MKEAAPLAYQREWQVRRSAGTGFLVFLLLLAFYYLAYRYPLQINSSTTSPTYSDTPFALQIAKYVILATGLLLFFVWSILKAPVARLRKGHLVDLLIAAFLFCQALVAAVVGRQPALFESGIFVSALFPYLGFQLGPIDISWVRRVCWWFVFLTFGTEIVQILLFLIAGRLPALAYGGGSYIVRFGGVWDDPNALGVFASFLVGVLLFSRLPFGARPFLLGATAVVMLLTQSLTGIGATMASLPIGLVLLFSLRPRKQWLGMLAGTLTLYVVALGVGALLLADSEILRQLAKVKAGSIAGHMRDVGSIGRASVLQYLGWEPAGAIGEPGYINMIVNHGVLFCGAYLLLGVRTALRLATLIVHNEGRCGVEVCYGAFFFVIAFYIGLLNLPLETVYPLNLLVVSATIIGYTGVTWGDGLEAVHPGARDGARLASL